MVKAALKDKNNIGNKFYFEIILKVLKIKKKE